VGLAPRPAGFLRRLRFRTPTAGVPTPPLRSGFAVTSGDIGVIVDMENGDLFGHAAV